MNHTNKVAVDVFGNIRGDNGNDELCGRNPRWTMASNVFGLRCLCNTKLHFLQTFHTPYVSHASKLYEQIVAIRSIALCGIPRSEAAAGGSGSFLHKEGFVNLVFSIHFI